MTGGKCRATDWLIWRIMIVVPGETDRITHYSEKIELIGWVLLPALMLILSEQFLSHTLFRRIP
jgi:hypothetical protein